MSGPDNPLPASSSFGISSSTLTAAHMNTLVSADAMDL